MNHQFWCSGELREDKDFFDVTLACDEDQVQVEGGVNGDCIGVVENDLGNYW